MNSFIVFTYLNLLDVISTLAVLHAGGREANPVPRWFMEIYPTPGVGLIIGKLVSIPVYWSLLKFAVTSWTLDGTYIMTIWNAFYMALIVWNLSNLL